MIFMSNYPSEIDTDAELASIYSNISELSPDALNSLKEAILAIEKTLGIDPQGSAIDLISRLDVSLNSDGTLSASALSSAGLISLPIDNSQIGAGAAILESKIDLDVGTQSLQDQITSNDIDIALLQKQYVDLLTRYLRHIAGTGDKHSSSAITHSLVDGYVSGAGTSVLTALNYLEGQLLRHKAEADTVQHYASVVSFEPPTYLAGETPVLTTSTVQEALLELDVALIDDRRKHNDEAHSNGVSNDGYVAFFGQAVVNDASLRTTRYQPNTARDQIKIGLCNSATIKSKGFQATSITSSSNKIDIDVSIDGVSRTISVVNLHTISYPLGISRVSLIGVVDYLNSQFSNDAAGAHFPLTAFASDDGEIVLQHNIDKTNCTITIRAPANQSAVEALGFSNLLDKEVSRFDNFSYYIDGNRFTELKTIADLSAAHPGTDPVDSFDLGQISGSGGLELEKGDLVHIYGHDADSDANGTYQINSVVGTNVELTESLTFGNFNCLFLMDSFSTNSFTGATNAAIEFSLNSDRERITSTRAELVYNSASGFSILEVSSDFPNLASAKINVTTSGSLKVFEIEDNLGNKGVNFSFLPGYIGAFKLFAPNNSSYLLIDVEQIVVADGTADLTSYASELQDDQFLLGSSFINASSGVISFPYDKRNVGLVGKDDIGTSYNKEVIERDVRNIHTDGMIRGLNVLSSTTNSLEVNGGQLYLNGSHISKDRTTVDVDVSTDGTFNLVIDQRGNYDIYEEGTGSGLSFSVAEILSSTDHMLVSQITVTGAAIDSVIDGRNFINDIESNFQLIVDDRELGGGRFKSLEAANLYAENFANGKGLEILVYSDLSLSSSLVIASDVVIIALGDLSITGSITLSSGSSLTVKGSLVVSGGVSLSTDATLYLDGSGNSVGSFVFATRSFLKLRNDVVSAGNLIVAGDDVKIVGENSSSTISLSGASLYYFSSGLILDRLVFSQDGATSATARVPIIDIFDGVVDFEITDCSFSQTGAVNILNWANALDESRCAIRRVNTSTQVGDNFSISNCTFSNFYTTFLELAGGVSNFVFEKNIVTNCNKGISFTSGDSKDIRISENNFSLIHEIFVEFQTGANIYNNVFSNELTSGTPPILILAGGASGGVGTAESFSIRDNNCFDLVTTSCFDVSANNASGDSSIQILNNNFYKCSSTTGYCFDLGVGDSAKIISGNSLWDHTGGVLFGSNFTFNSNTVNVIDFSTGGAVVFDVQDSDKNIISDNFISLQRSSGSNILEMALYNGLVSNNYIDAGLITSTLSASTDPNEVVFSNNQCILATGGVAFSGGAIGKMLISGNNILVSSDATALSIEDDITAADPKVTIISNNVLEAIGNTTEILKIGPLVGGAGASNNIWSISDNIIRGDVGKGINLVSPHNVSITNNMIYDCTGNDIEMASTLENLYVVGNFAEGGDIVHGNSSPVNVYIGENKGVNQAVSFSNLSFIIGSDWEISTDEVWVSTAAGTDELLIPLSLPNNVNIVSAGVNINATVLNSISVRLYRRDGLTSTEIGSAFSPAAFGIGLLTFTPSSSEYVKSGQDYYLKVTSNTIGDIVANAVVNIKY